MTLKLVGTPSEEGVELGIHKILRDGVELTKNRQGNRKAIAYSSAFSFAGGVG